MTLITHDDTDHMTLCSHDAGPGVGTQLSPGWQSTCHPLPSGRLLCTPGPDLPRPGPGAAQAQDTRNGQTERLRDFIKITQRCGAQQGWVSVTLNTSLEDSKF